MKKTSFEDALILNAAKAARAVFRRLPLPAALFLGKILGTCVYAFSKRRAVAYKNLRAAFASEKTPSELRRIARRSMQGLVMSAVEMLRFPEMTAETVGRQVTIQGRDKISSALGGGKGVIFLTGHFGNWELLSAAASLSGYPATALARAQKHPRSDEFLNALRASKGTEIIRKGMMIRQVLRALKAGKIVGMVIDQDGGKKGVFVRFFGRLSSTPPGAAAFAQATGAVIFPVFIFREKDGRHRIEIEEPIDAGGLSEKDVLQRFADALEEKIRRCPDQWLWAHRRWKSTPDRFVWVLDDGKAGHVNQSMAVLDAYCREREARGFLPEHTHMKIVPVRFKSAVSGNILKLLCFLFGGRVPFRMAVLKAVLEKTCFEEILRGYADLVISCGASTLGVNAAVKAENGAKAVAVMKPYFSPAVFDAVIAPRHDKMKESASVFVTENAPSRVTGENGPAGKWPDLPVFPCQRIGLFIGGDTGHFKFDPAILKDALEGVLRHAAGHSAVVAATSSRRTPAWAEALMKNIFSDRSRCPLLVIANEANREGVVGGMLNWCDVAIVTAESLSMVSEAAASGKPVLVFAPAKRGEQSLKSKHRAFLRHLARLGAVTETETADLFQWLGRGVPANGIGASLAARDRETLMRAVQAVAV